MSDLPLVPSVDPFERLRHMTPARVGLGRYGSGMPTQAALDFQLAHARARDAVFEPFQPTIIQEQLRASRVTLDTITVNSRAKDRQSYLRNPDWGRALLDRDAHRLNELKLMPDGKRAVFVIGDGLSARAVHTHAVATLCATVARSTNFEFAPIVIAQFARVALGDEIGQRLGADLTIVLIGERPGLSAPDSLGAYLTWNPRLGRNDSERNCISNIRPPIGLSYESAGDRIAWMMDSCRRLQLSGVKLKDHSEAKLVG